MNSLHTRDGRVEAGVAISAHKRLVLVASVDVVSTSAAVEELEVSIVLWVVGNTHVVCDTFNFNSRWKICWCRYPLSVLLFVHNISIWLSCASISNGTDFTQSVTSEEDCTMVRVPKTTSIVDNWESTVKFPSVVAVSGSIRQLLCIWAVRSIVNPVSPVIELCTISLELIFD